MASAGGLADLLRDKDLLKKSHPRGEVERDGRRWRETEQSDFTCHHPTPGVPVGFPAVGCSEPPGIWFKPVFVGFVPRTFGQS